MPKTHRVRQGECVESIAARYGLFWETIWNDGANAELRSKRGNPNILQEGDELEIPDLRVRREAGATGARHRFRRKGVPCIFRVVVRKYGQPRAKERYSLEIDGRWFEGQTDGEGRIEQPIPPDARRGRLRVGEGDELEEFEVRLGCSDPHDEVSGVQSRLSNLGYGCDSRDGELDPRTREAIEAFQRDAGLEVTGEADPATRDALKREHRS